jgi:hypothetical protein
MNSNLVSPLSREFAINVANWRVEKIESLEGDGSWEMWRNENGVVVFPPKFAESVDLLLPFVNKFMNISGSNGFWCVNFVVNSRNDMATGSGDSLSEALAKALIDEEKLNRY